MATLTYVFLLCQYYVFLVLYCYKVQCILAINSLEFVLAVDLLSHSYCKLYLWQYGFGVVDCVKLNSKLIKKQRVKCLCSLRTHFEFYLLFVPCLVEVHVAALLYSQHHSCPITSFAKEFWSTITHFYTFDVADMQKMIMENVEMAIWRNLH